MYIVPALCKTKAFVIKLYVHDTDFNERNKYVGITIFKNRCYLLIVFLIIVVTMIINFFLYY